MGTKTSRQQGFTLIEVLLALVVVALASFTVVMNIPVSADDAAHKQARQLYYRLQLMNEEALLSGQELGVWISPKREKLVLVGLQAEGWQPLKWSRINSEIILDEQVVLDFSLKVGVWQDDDRLFKPDSDDKDEKPVMTPQILLMSSGEVTPFLLRFEPKAQADQGWVVKANEISQIELLTAAEANDE
jgi:general secretion pathway protein H